MINNSEDYNSIPVYYCKRCLSLKILSIDEDSDLSYCDDCGNTDIDSIDIETWRKMYKEKYNKQF